MLFVVEYADRPGAAEKRAALRDQHIAYRRGLGEKLKLAGPLLRDDGQGSVGSLIVLDAADRAEAESLAKSDPYVASQVFDFVKATAFRVALSRAFA